MTKDSAIAAIDFALTKELSPDESLEFLSLWREGRFEDIRNYWPECPPEVFAGAEVVSSGTETGHSQSNSSRVGLAWLIHSLETATHCSFVEIDGYTFAFEMLHPERNTQDCLLTLVGCNRNRYRESARSNYFSVDPAYTVHVRKGPPTELGDALFDSVDDLVQTIKSGNYYFG